MIVRAAATEEQEEVDIEEDAVSTAPLRLTICKACLCLQGDTIDKCLPL